MVCLDSDIIIDFLKNDKETIRKIEQLKQNEPLSTTSINSFEILRGLSKINKSDIAYNFLLNLKILDFNFESSKKAAEISEELRKSGNPLDIADIMIASVVIENKESLLTGNIRHFKRIPSLKLAE